MVLLVRVSNGAWWIATDPETAAGSTFQLMWIAVVAGANAVTAVFIFQAANRRNWARIAILVWTVGSWSLWFFYSQDLDQYSVEAVAAGLALPLVEAGALLLLFGRAGSTWYSPPSHAL
jgi:hypothetical protein